MPPHRFSARDHTHIAAQNALEQTHPFLVIVDMDILTEAERLTITHHHLLPLAMRRYDPAAVPQEVLDSLLYDDPGPRR